MQRDYKHNNSLAYHRLDISFEEMPLKNILGPMVAIGNCRQHSIELASDFFMSLLIFCCCSTYALPPSPPTTSAAKFINILT